MSRRKIREYLLTEMKKVFVDWDFSPSQAFFPPASKTKVNLYFPSETFDLFSDGPRILESHLICEIEISKAFEKEKPGLELELSQILHWVERNRFLGGLVLNSQVERIDSWEDYNGERPIAFCKVTLQCVTHQNLLEAS